MTIAEKIKSIQDFIQKSPNPEVKLIVVSKYATIEQMIEAYEAGARCFGENYVKPALEKQEALKPVFKEKVEWHLIGHLQKNKAKKVVGQFDLIHSVDSIDLASKINDEAQKLNIKQDILCQINTSNEDNKSGFEPEAFKDALIGIQKLENINFKGLMTMGPSGFENKNDYLQEMETIFEQMRQMKRELAPNFCELSMGMTSDFRLAINSGSTMIRIGSAIFDDKKSEGIG